MGAVAFSTCTSWLEATTFGSQLNSPGCFIREKFIHSQITMANFTGDPLALAQITAMAYGNQDFGYPAGVKLIDMVPDHLKPHVQQHWHQFPPVNPMWHYILGLAYMVLLFFSFIGNGLVVYLFNKHDPIKTPSNFLVCNLALADLIMLITNAPVFIYNCFNNGQWSFSIEYCAMYAALGAVTGVCSIYTLVCISFDRYNIIFNCCCPLMTILGCYLMIIKAISAHESAMRAQAQKMNVKSLRTAEANEQRAEIRIARTAMFNIAIWICGWTPYASITLQGSMGKFEGLKPLTTTLPALLAKSISCYNPFVYAIGHPKYRQAMTVHCPWFCIHEPEQKADDASAAEGKA